MNPDSKIARLADWVNLKALLILTLVFIGAEVLPIWLVAQSNKHVFPETADMANLILLTPIIASLVCILVSSLNTADWILKTGAVLLLICLGAVNWWNYAGHWQLAREVSAAESAKKEYSEQLKEQDELAEKANKREISRLQALSVLTAQQAEQARQDSLKIDSENRRCRITKTCRPLAPPSLPQSLASIEAAPSPTPSPIMPATGINAAPKTRDEIRQSHLQDLTFRANCETAFSIIGMVLIAGLWKLGEIDFDGNGVPDGIDRLPAAIKQKFYPQYQNRTQEKSQLQDTEASLKQSPAGANLDTSRGRSRGKG